MQMFIEMFNRLNDPFALVHTGLQLMIIPPNSTKTLHNVSCPNKLSKRSAPNSVSIENPPEQLFQVG